MIKELQDLLLNITSLSLLSIASIPKKTDSPEWMNVTVSGDFPPDDFKNRGIRADEYNEDKDSYFDNIIFPCPDHVL